jgi:hypothetical protein
MASKLLMVMRTVMGYEEPGSIAEVAPLLVDPSLLADLTEPTDVGKVPLKYTAQKRFAPITWGSIL